MTLSRGLAAFVLAVLAATAASAQEVRRVGSADIALDRRFSRLLAAGVPVLEDDTLVVAGDTLWGDVLVLDATLILEGVVTGDVVGVDAGLWVRAGAEVWGDVVNAGGGLYRSYRARIRGRIFDLPDAPYYVERQLGRLDIVARDAPAPLRLDGALGVHDIRYDRVDGVSLAWGASYALPLLGPIQPRIHGWAGVRTERGAFGWGGDLAVRIGTVRLTGGVERTTRTPDAWLRAPTVNSLSYLWDGDDYYNRYDADRIHAGLRHSFGDERRRFHAELGAEAQIEEARSLSAGSPWTVIRDPVRPNPPIDEGRLVSLTGILDLEWSGLTTVIRSRTRVESGRTVLDGVFAFDRFETWGTWAIRSVLDHTLEVSWRLQGPLPGTDSLPRQRWSTVGGITTLQTYDIGFFRGDRLAFIRTDYIIPFPDWLAFPLVGAPDLYLTHAAGRAWTTAVADPVLEQNVGVQLQFFGVYLRYMHDPSGATEDSILLGVAWPFAPGYPWQP